MSEPDKRWLELTPAERKARLVAEVALREGERRAQQQGHSVAQRVWWQDVLLNLFIRFVALTIVAGILLLALNLAVGLVGHVPFALPSVLLVGILVFAILRKRRGGKRSAGPQLHARRSAAHPTQRPASHAPSDSSAMASGEMIYVAAVRLPIGALLPESVLRAVLVSEDQLALEVFALRLQAAHYAMYLALEHDNGRLMTLVRELYSAMKADELAPMRGSDLLSFLSTRRNEYTGAIGVMASDAAVSNEALSMLPSDALGLQFTGSAERDVGVLFAHFCAVPHDVTVRMMGTVVFTETAAVVRSLL